MFICADGIRDMVSNLRVMAPVGCENSCIEHDIEQWKLFLKERTEFIEGSGFDIQVAGVYHKAHNTLPPYIGKDGSIRRLPKYVPLSEYSSEYMAGDDVYHLTPGYYLLQSEEVVSLPSYVGGLVLPRSSFFVAECLLGFTRIAPGFSGQLRCGLYVCGDHGLYLERKAKFATVMFYRFTHGKTDSYKGIWHGDRMSTNDKIERAS
jgi:deoxycytidine triphosphate deaminase